MSKKSMWSGAIIKLQFLVYHSSYTSNDMANTLLRMQVFNEFNARKPDEKNIFRGITKNYLFIGIVALTVILQVRLLFHGPYVVLCHIFGIANRPLINLFSFLLNRLS